MSETATRQSLIERARRVVVKVGTNALTDPAGRLDTAFAARLSAQIAEALRSGVDVTLVSSGAIGAGMAELDLPGRPRNLPRSPATAAVGQGELMRTFHDAFGAFGVKVAQILLTRDDFQDRARYLNIRNTIAALADCRALPIINENDTVSVDEIRFGDNDLIAALVANMVDADLLVLLTDVDGFLRDGEVVDRLEAIDEDAVADAGGAGAAGVGGMRSKLQAAGMVTGAGAVVVIADARADRCLTRLLAGEDLGTLCVPARRRLNARRRWIGHAARTAGKLFVDAGAARAVSQDGKSLLASGITGVGGRFAKGANVAIVGPRGEQIARGLTNYSAEQIDRIKGLRTSQFADVLGDKPYDEVVHRNNMTLS
ncbi:MAG: glutamate 5-kinase [Planctomycetota bacterium]